METQAEYTTDTRPDQIEDASGDHSYFAMMPNMLDDLLDPYQYRLYAHYKRVCGESGKCWQSTETTAEKCKMSTGKVAETKRELSELGLITVTLKPRPNGGRPYHIVRVIDIWARNLKHCREASSRGEQASSPREVKKTPCIKKTPEREGATAPPAPAEEWPTERAERGEDKTPDNPADKHLDRMRAKFGDNILDVTAHCSEAQAAEGAWTVPKYDGLSPANAVFRDATGYRAGKAQREIIDEHIPNNNDALHQWYRVCRGWMATYDNHKNVAGMLDWYAEGRVSRGKPNGNGRHDKRQGEQGVTDEQKRRLEAALGDRWVRA